MEAIFWAKIFNMTILKVFFTCVGQMFCASYRSNNGCNWGYTTINAWFILLISWNFLALFQILKTKWVFSKNAFQLLIVWNLLGCSIIEMTTWDLVGSQWQHIKWWHNGLYIDFFKLMHAIMFDPRKILCNGGCWSNGSKDIVLFVMNHEDYPP